MTDLAARAAERPVAPVAEYRSRRVAVLLAGVPVLAFTGWAGWHAVSAIDALAGSGHRLALLFALSFLLLWWVPLSWWERPRRVSAAEQAGLDDLVVLVQVPVYNEDPAALRACLASLLEQTRLPQRIRVTDDGSQVDYGDVRDAFAERATTLGVEVRWDRTPNRGKRHAQMVSLAGDDSDILVTLDSDSVLDRAAVAEGLKPFADASVTSVAGLIAVLNTRRSWLTGLTAMLYIPFTRGFRSAQSVFGRVLINSGTLAFYRRDVIRPYEAAYAHETFHGRPMQMNDDSLMTLYAVLNGRTVHQPSAVAYTLVPDTLGQYRRQQLRWMRGTFIRTLWWFRYAPCVLSPVFWMPLIELVQLMLAVLAPVVLLCDPQLREQASHMVWTMVGVAVALNWIVGLRLLILARSDEPLWLHLVLFVLTPLAGVWRTLVVRPMHLYALATFWRVGSWGTRADGVEVTLAGHRQSD